MVQKIGTIEIARTLTDHPERFTIVRLEEIIQVRQRSIKMMHTYWVPIDEDWSNEDNYLEPIDHPDSKLQLDFRQYRDQFGLLTATDIRQIREGYRLSLRQFSLLLGSDQDVLAEIESGLLLQTDLQESLFRLAQVCGAFESLVYAKRAIIPADQYREIVNKVKSL